MSHYTGNEKPRNVSKNPRNGGIPGKTFREKPWYSGREKIRPFFSSFAFHDITSRFFPGIPVAIPVFPGFCARIPGGISVSPIPGLFFSTWNLFEHFAQFFLYARRAEVVLIVSKTHARKNKNENESK